MGKETAERLLKLVSAILVVGAITGTAFLLFAHRTITVSSGIPTGGPDGPIKTPITVQSQAGGLEASLRITSGPYFLSELLGVQITLTNHSNKNVPLSKSGRVTIATEARFFTATKDRSGNEVVTTGSNALEGHWPVIHINVNAQVPADRTLSLQQQGPHITIDAPATIQSQLVYFDSIHCVMQPGSEYGTSGKWDAVSAKTLQQPECSGTNKHWSFAVSAPGFAIVSGVVSY